MKKFLMIFVLLLLCGCSKTITYDQPIGNISDMSNYSGLVSEQFVDLNMDELFTLIDNKKTFIVYLGYDTCNWCNALVPVLNEVSIEKEMKVYYLNIYGQGNMDSQAMNKIKSYCQDFYYEDEASQENKFYLPSVLYFQKGEVVARHVGTVSGHDANEKALSEKQRARLVYQLEQEFDAIIQMK